MILVNNFIVFLNFNELHHVLCRVNILRELEGLIENEKSK